MLGTHPIDLSDCAVIRQFLSRLQGFTPPSGGSRFKDQLHLWSVDVAQHHPAQHGGSNVGQSQSDVEPCFWSIDVGKDRDDSDDDIGIIYDLVDEDD